MGPRQAEHAFGNAVDQPVVLVDALAPERIERGVDCLESQLRAQQLGGIRVGTLVNGDGRETARHRVGVVSSAPQ